MSQLFLDYKACHPDKSSQSALFFGIDADHRLALSVISLFELSNVVKRGVSVFAFAGSRALLGFAPDKAMMAQQALDHRYTDGDAVIVGQVRGNLLIREVGALHRCIHGRSGGVIPKHLQKGVVEFRNDCIAGLAPPARSPNAGLAERVGIM